MAGDTHHSIGVGGSPLGQPQPHWQPSQSTPVAHCIFKVALDMETNVTLGGHVSIVTRKLLPLHLWSIVKIVSSQVSRDF